MKKQYKITSNKKRKKFIQTFIQFILIELLIVILFLFTFYNTSKANTQNTHTIDTSIIDVVVCDGSNKLATVYLETPMGFYKTDWKTYDKKNDNPFNSEELKNSLTEEQSTTLTVLNNSKKTSVLYGNTMTVVDIRSESTVYYDMADYNQWQTENRIITIIFSVFVEVIIVVWFSFKMFLVL